MKKKGKKIENHDDCRADIMEIGGNYDVREAEAKLQTSLKQQRQRNYGRKSYW